MSATPLPAAPMRRADLRDLGVSAIELRDLLRTREVLQVFRGVYVPAAAVEDPLVRAAAAAAVLPPGAAVARETAAWLYGVDCRSPGEHRRPLSLCCVVPAGAHAPPRHAGLVSYQAALPEADVVEHLGVPVTSAERTVLDLARYLPAYMGLATADAFAHRRLVDLERLRARVAEWTGERWIARCRRVLWLADARAESFGESWLRLRIVEAGFPTPQLQIWVVDEHGVGVYRLDLGWEEVRVAVEYDGDEYHGDDDARRRDEARREELARAFGWEAVGVGKGDVLGRSMRLERGVGELLGLEPAITRRAW